LASLSRSLLARMVRGRRPLSSASRWQQPAPCLLTVVVGKNFINDPKVAGETEVKATIKLRFRTSQGSRIIASRSFQLTQKKTTVQYKTLDGTIQTMDKNTGEKKAVNHRCIDMDRTVPILMGVSKAILENVIFVHQEDSSWPLDDGATLKKKFDDIFSATKYTKALEALHKLKKEQNQAVKEMKLKMETLQSHMDQALRYREQVATGEEKVVKLQGEIDGLKSEMDSIEGERAALNEKLEEIADLAEEINALRSKLEMKQQQNTVMLEELEDGEPQDDLEELERVREQMQASLHEGGKLKEKMQGPLDECLGKVETTRKQHRQEVDKHSRLKAEADMHENNISERSKLIYELAQKTGMMSVPDDGQLDSQAAAVFSDHIRQTADKLATELREVKSNNRAADTSISEKLAKTEAEIASAASTISGKQRQKEQKESQLAQREHQAGQIQMSDEMLQEFEEEVERCEEELASAQKRLEEQNYDAKLKSADQQLTEMGRTVSNLREERKTVEAASESSTRLRMRKREMLQVKQKAESMAETNKRELLKFTSMEKLPELESLKGVLADTVSRKKRDAEKKETERRKAESKVAAVKAKQDAADHQVANTRAKADKLRDKVLKSMDAGTRSSMEGSNAGMDNVLAERTRQKEEHETRLQKLKAYNQVVGSVISESEDNRCCSFCKRKFDTTKDLQDFLESQEKMVEALPARIETLQTDLKESKQQLANLSKLHPIWLQYENIRKDLPELESKAELLHAELRSCEDNAKSLAKDHDALQELLSTGTNLLHGVGASVENLCQQSSQYAKEIADLERKMAMDGSQAARNVADVDSELEKIERDRDRVRAERDELSKKQTTATRSINLLSTKYHTARGEAQEAHNRRREKEKLKAEAEELEAELATLMEDIAMVERNQAPLRNSLQSLITEREELRKVGSETEKTLEEELQTFRGMAEDLKRLNDPIDKYIKAGKASQMEASSARMTDLEEEISSLEARAKELEATVRSQEDEVLRREALLRKIKDQMQYLRSRLEEGEYQQNIRRLEERVSQVGDQQAFIRKMDRMNSSLDGLRDKRSMKKGSIDTERSGVRKAQVSLQEPQYQDIDSKCRSQQIKQKTTEMATRDLEKYHKALEKALQSYHTSKMADINTLIKELWQKTYRNQDIDFIMIKSDADGQRSYNYRVVMVCQDAELDMRGRCSAGQKVLACLIIRLALAETFCLNCGILTLDEPTTNLDAANAASLADALRRLMKDRENQDNFQMVVITHDERFAGLIGTREHVDHIWRVTKDEGQHSHLETEPVES